MPKGINRNKCKIVSLFTRELKHVYAEPAQ